MPSNNWIEEVGDKRKILSKENIKKAQAALKEKREKEKNKPLEFESDDDNDETPVLTFKNKDKKRYKEIKAKMDLLIESQRQLREDFQKRKEKKKVVIERVVEEKKSDNHVSQLLSYFNASKEEAVPNFQR